MKHFKTLVIALLMATVASAQTAINRLVLPDMQVRAGQDIQLPIQLDNVDEVAAMQFDLILPTGITMADNGVSLSSRAKSTHTITGRMMTDERCRVMVHSAKNKTIRGNEGDLIYVNLKVQSSVTGGEAYRMDIRDLVVSDANGDDIPMADAYLGKITTSTMPDLKIEDLAVASSTNIGPDSTVYLTWKVSNVGELPTTAGWSEEITLVGTDGASRYLGTITYNGTLASGASVNRSTSVTLPSIPMVDGRAVFAVKVVPASGAGEPASALINNEMISGEVTVSKHLTFNIPTLIQENHKYRLSGTITRSGSRVYPEQFYLTCAPTDSRISFPSPVTIEAGQSSKSFTIIVANNSTLDNDSIFKVTLTGVGYDKIEREIKVVDDELPRLTVELSDQSVKEGGDFGITVTVERAPKEDLTVQLSTNNASRVTLLATTLTIPAGETTVTGGAIATINDVPELDSKVRVRASATNHYTGWADVTVRDDDIPQLQLTTIPTAIGEGNDSVIAQAIISRTTNLDKRVTVRLTSNDTGNLRVRQSQVTMEAGVNSVEVQLTPVDNSIVDHDRTVRLTAEVYLPSNNCYATALTPGFATTTIEVLDDDGPTLSMSPYRNVWVEGSQGRLWIGRNTLASEGSVTVTLTSDHEDMLDYNHTVTIPVGQTGTYAYVTVKKNTVKDDSFTATFTATAVDYNKAVCSVQVNDTSLPDATFKSFSLSSSSLEITSPFTATAVVENVGYLELPAETQVTVYAGSQVIATAQLGKELQVGESITLTFPLTASSTVGTTSYHAVVNNGNKVQEMNYSNNKSSSASLYTSPGFTTTLTTDKQLYKPGETVKISGQAQGNHAQDAPILIYIMWSGNRQTITTTAGLDGSFEAEWQPYAGQAGHVTIGSSHPSVYSTTAQASIDIYGLRLTSKSGVRYDLEEEHDASHDITIYNPGPALTGVTAEVVKQPSNCTVTLANASIGTLGSGKSATIPMKITETRPSAHNSYDSILVRITSLEGPQVETLQWLHCRYHRAHLQLDQSRLDLTLVKNRSREIQVDITNVGLRETGEVTCVAQKWVSAVTPIPSIQPGETVPVTLTLTAPEDSHLMDPYPASRVSFTCANGDGALLTLTVTVVSQEKGRLIVTTCDERTVYNEGNPRLSGATITLSHPLTGEKLYTGITNEEGQFIIDEITEGYYNITATAPKHESFSKTRYLVNAGRDNELTAMLWMIPTQDIIIPDPNPDDPEDPDKPGGGASVDWVVDVDVDDPVAAITVHLPKARPLLNMIVPIEVTNHGNVPVGRTELTFIVPNGYEMEIIDKPLFSTVQAHSTVTFQAVLRAVDEDAEMPSCFELGATAHAQYVCGPFSRVIETTGRRAWGTCGDDVALEWQDDPIDPSPGNDPRPSVPVGGQFDIDGIVNSISFQLSRTTAMTGQTIHAWLTVNNKSDKTVNGLWFDLRLLDDKGESVLDDELFTCTAQRDGQWSVGKKSVGTDEIDITPTVKAAEDTPQRYYIGGTMHYTHPTTGEVGTINIMPLPVYINPMARLDMDYFLQRDIFGDDLWTAGVTEPSIPAEFSLLISNSGNGPAPNTTIVTRKPRIYNNNTGYPLDFKLVGSQLNGHAFTPTVLDDITTRFGTINTGATAYAQWWFESSFMGYFANYDVVRTNLVTQDMDQRVIGDITVHELIHSVNIDMEAKTPLKGFLVNESMNEEHRPDKIYLTTGDIQDVGSVASAKWTTTSSTECKLLVTVGKEGWNYGTVTDPTRGRQKIAKVVRTSDGQEIDLHNFWLTDRTMPDGMAPIYENLMHFADVFTTGTQEYIVTFTTSPTTALDVKAFEGVPLTETLLTSPLTQLDVVFNKDIDPTTFTASDMSLTCQGNLLDIDKMGITPKGDSKNTYTLDLSQLTQHNGYYILTVNTRGIIDTENFAGEALRHAEWMQITGGEVNLTVNATPSQGGTVTPESRGYAYNAQVTLKATPNDSYSFSHWTQDGEVVSQDAEFTVTLTDDVEYTAHFVPRRYVVNVTSTGGTVEGGMGKGYYQYGDALEFKAKALSGWHFDGWSINNRPAGTSKKLDVKVTDDMEIEACFTQKNVDVNIKLNEGWSWITPTILDPVLQDSRNFLASVEEDVERLVDITTELVNDPKYHLVGNLDFLTPRSSYKIKMARNSNIKLYGRISMNDEIRVEATTGWTWMGYVPSVPMDVNDALSNMKPQKNDIIKGKDNCATYVGGKWTGTLTTMQPNEGYMYYSHGEGQSFHYPNNHMRLHTAGTPTGIAYAPEQLPWHVDSHKYADNITVIATVHDPHNMAQAEEYTIGAFVGDECRGIGKWVDGRLFITIHGQSSDNHISFKALDIDGEECDVEEVMNFSIDHVGTYSDPYVLHVKDATGLGDVAQGNDYIICPNPVHDVLYIAGNTTAIKAVNIVSMSGATVLQAQGYNADKGIDVSSLAAGNYLLGIKTQQGTVYKRFIKVS